MVFWLQVLNMTLVIALGFRDGKVLSKSLYLGDSVDDARLAVKNAGEKGSIDEGIVCKNFHKEFIHRRRFDKPVSSK
jgi:hypothetical protein